MLRDLVMDAALDSLKLLPFLFFAFLVLELLQKSSGKLNQKMLVRFQTAGPLIGALLGCVPECGFPIVAANLFAASLISPGTLLAVFLSSSDEALLMLFSMPRGSHVIPTLLILKVFIALFCGYVLDFFFAKHFQSEEIAELHDQEHCCHGHNHNLFLHAFWHALNLFFFIFVFNLGLNLLLELIGFSNLASLMLKNSIFQPILSAIIGLIPNCAASVLITELFGQGILSFASLVSGLCSTTGLGMFVLLKTCKEKKLALKLLLVLLACAVLAGILLSVFL